MFDAVAKGEQVPAALLGPLRDSSDARRDGAELRRRLDQDGYVYVPGLLDQDDVLAARRDVFSRLAAVGEIAAPVDDGIVTGQSRRRELHPDLGAFWREVCASWALRRVTNGAALTHFVSTLLGEPARPQDFLFLRAAPAGRATGIHCDSPFFTRTTERVLTCWLALGPVPVDDGPLFVVEGSHRFEDLTLPMRGFDLMRDQGRQAAVSDDPIGFARERRTRLLTADFGPGDVLVFPMLTFHGSFDNHSPIGRARLSCDVRFQPESEPRDPRYFGPEPTGTTGAGYGELNGAKPLTDPWHVR